MREMLSLQPRFRVMRGKRAMNLLEHRRFRAAYDFHAAAVRGRAGDDGLATSGRMCKRRSPKNARRVFRCKPGTGPNASRSTASRATSRKVRRTVCERHTGILPTSVWAAICKGRSNQLEDAFELLAGIDRPFCRAVVPLPFRAVWRD